MYRGKLAIVALLVAAGCSRTTGVRVQLALEDGAPAPETVELSVFDRYGGVAYGVPLEGRLPGDLLVLVSRDAELVRVVARGIAGGLVVVAGASATPVVPDKELPLPLTLSASMPTDSDGDGVPDVIDACPTAFDPEQAASGEGPGDACREVIATVADFGMLRTNGDLATAARPDMAAPPNADLGEAKTALCGDGVVDAGEDCDDGAANSDAAADAATCTTACRKRAGCGSLSGASAAQIDAMTGHCYVSWPTKVNWATASRQCESRGGHLAVVTSAAENSRIQTLAGLADRWIGLKIDHGQTARDHWVNGEAVSYTSYAATEPNNGGGTPEPEACGVFDATRGAWDDRPCGFPDTGDLPFSYIYTLGYLCENECGNGVVDPGEGCDPPGPGCTTSCQKARSCTEPGAVISQVNGHCYFALASAVSFTDALAACPAGTHLATLDEIAESETGSLAVGGSDAWIALRAATTQGNYLWTVGTEIFNAQRYHGFASDEPNESIAPPLCARITPLQGWKDRSCDSLYLPLCERE
jgi:hypothetical protein